MKEKNAILLVFLTLFAAITLAGGQTSTKAGAAQGTLNVKVKYTGAGIVDEKHQIYVFLVDANPYMASTLIDATSQSTPPAAQPGVAHLLVRQAVASKDKTATFRELGVSPVYALAYFDKDGTSKGDIESASKAPMGAYGIPPEKLEAIKIEPGKTVQVVVTFDDSRTTP